MPSFALFVRGATGNSLQDVSFWSVPRGRCRIGLRPVLLGRMQIFDGGDGDFDGAYVVAVKVVDADA